MSNTAIMNEANPSGSKPRTPPRPPANLELTPEQVKQVELNRLKGERNKGPRISTYLTILMDYPAKARQRDRESEAGPSATPNGQGKRAMRIVPATSASPTAPQAVEKLKRDSRLGKYFEYDLSKMVNSKGGFLVEDGKEVDEQLRAKEKERERQRAMQNLDPRKTPCSLCALVLLTRLVSR